MSTEKTNSKKPVDSFSFQYIKDFFNDVMDLRKGVNKQATIDEIKSKKSMSGANAWMLMCSIIIASIGLDRDSDAVIIGAMLISPLMSPILGIGLGIGINDKDVIKSSITHFSAAILIALLTSFIYFYFSPFGQVTPSIEARTEPLTLDVLVAIFGGLAGIISIARKDISTTLPGVAIATALMPPLCVTGFGLAKGNWNFALNSFYLFTLNTSFICLSTYLIVRYLRFPYRRYINSKERLRNRIVVAIFSLLIVIPSFFILQNVLKRLETKNAIKTFVENEFKEDRIFLDSYSENITDSISTLILKVYGNKINQEEIPKYEADLKKLGLTEWKIAIIQSSDVNLKTVQDLENKVNEIGVISQREREIRKAENKLNKLESDSLKIADVSKEFRIVFNEKDQISFANMYKSERDSTMTRLSTFVLDTEAKIDEDTEQKMQLFLQARMKLDSIRLIIVNN